MVRSLSLSVSSSLFPCPRLLHYIEATWLLQATLGAICLRWCSASRLHTFNRDFLEMLPWQSGTLY